MKNFEELPLITRTPDDDPDDPGSGGGDIDPRA